MNSPVRSMLLAYSFRIFFPLAALYAAVAILAWIAFLLGWALPVPSTLNSLWHAHEMLYGFVSAAIAGFLLTAMTNWTGAPPLAGRGLAALMALWLAGRVAMWNVASLPYWLIALVEGLFLPVMALYVAVILQRYGNKRNFVLVAVLLGMATGNGLMHCAVLLDKPVLAAAGRDFGLDLITLLMIVVAGRITPAFTLNWLRMRGVQVSPPFWPWLTPLAMGSVIVLALSHLLGLPDGVVGLLAMLAGVVNLLRLASWRGWQALAEPLLWILHAAYLFIPIALLARAAFLLGFMDNASFWYHALGIGAIGTLILGVMTRVSVGHTGRPMRLLPGAIFIYIGVLCALVMRLLVSLGWFDYSLGLTIAAVTWVGAFVLFAGIYGPLLNRPRPDGRAG